MNNSEGNILFDIFANAFESDKEDWKTRISSARELKRQYDALKYVGFTDEQAMRLVEAMISGMLSAVVEKE